MINKIWRKRTIRNFSVIRVFVLILLLVAALPLPAVSDYQDNIDRTFKVHEGGTLTITSDLTSGGSIQVDEVMGHIDASTSGGSITVDLNPECEVNINAKTIGGKVTTDLPVTLTDEFNNNKLIANINGGGPELYMRTSGGGIHLHQK